MKESITLMDVWTVNEQEGTAKDRWTKMGIAFINRDESINVILDALPLNGRLQLRKRQVKKEVVNE